ncbi:MAG: hypothetical protein B6U68_01235 [Candidatus Aenigmarchaeota archaeon ex4484_14]|nr:MAG: hypothetical protein B6U68_01235 [Candidatus Aenigmarchaeota archaeon ex4484_14]
MYEINLLKKLVALNTNSATKENYKECAQLIANETRKLGMKTKIIDVPAPDKKPRPNVLAELDVGAEKTLLLVTHYDIVPVGSGWHTNPLSLTIKNGKAFGRGVADDKGAIVEALGAVRNIRKSGKKSRFNIKLVCACDEEVGGKYGLRYVCQRHKKDVKADLALVIDSGLENIIVGCSGVIDGKITVKGKAWHAGYPHQADNPIYKAITIVEEIRKWGKKIEKRHSELKSPKGSPHRKVWNRLTVTVFKAGEKANVIPGEAVIEFDYRLLPEQKLSEAKKEIREVIKKINKKLGINSKLRILSEHSGYITDEHNPIVQEFKKYVTKIFGRKEIVGQLGAMDGTYTAAAGIPSIGFGPGGGNHHAPDEFIALKDIRKMKELIVKFCKG